MKKTRAPRPHTGYIQFTIEKRADVVKKNPGATPKQLMKLMGDAWQVVSASEKTAYSKRAVEAFNAKVVV